MYYAVWDDITSGIILTPNQSAEAFTAMRPVFHEELDLLGLDKIWSYPRIDTPLLWTNPSHHYFYRGQLVAKATAKGYFHRPEVKDAQDGLVLEPVDMVGMRSRNAPILNALAHEAMDFIHDATRKLSPRVDATVVAFSGGKDSLALLDLVQRTLEPQSYNVIFSDTGMELSNTLQAVERAKQHWNHLTIHTARSHMDASYTWRAFGPPSRLHRWCCAVHKSVPTLLYLRKLTGLSNVRALVFDGVRNDESHSRSLYERITSGGKHGGQTNASPLLRWNEVEVYLYLFWRDIMFNDAYRHGAARVGCCMCPMASKWWDSLAYSSFEVDSKPLVDVLIEYAHNMNRDSEEAVIESISSRAWCGRAGGRYLGTGENRVSEVLTGHSWRGLCSHGFLDAKTWLQTLGRTEQINSNKISVLSKKYSFVAEIVSVDETEEVCVNIPNGVERSVLPFLRTVAHKTAYCLGCRACEAECPRGALDIQARKVDKNLCIHCGKCHTFTEKGCWAARSLRVSSGEASVKGLNRYNHFGMRTEWLSSFLDLKATWWQQHGIGNRQFDAMRVWLREALFIDKDGPTPLAEVISRFGAQSPFLWEIIWFNLAQNSALVRWYLDNVAWGERVDKQELIRRAGDRLSTASRDNAMKSLLALLRDTPLGGMGFGPVSKERAVSFIHKKGLSQLSRPETLLYALFFKAQTTGQHGLTLSEFHACPEHGPAHIYGLSEQATRTAVQSLAASYPQLLRVEFVRDLDNIFLTSEINGDQVVELVALS